MNVPLEGEEIQMDYLQLLPETNREDTENGDQYEDMFHNHSFELTRENTSFFITFIVLNFIQSERSS